MWGTGETQYTDYEIAPELLRRGPLRFAASADDPGALLYDDDGDPDTPRRPLPGIASAYNTPHGISTWMAAHASELPDQEWVRALGSNNRYFQAQARRHVRKLSNSELQAVLRTSDLSESARRALVREIQRRKKQSNR